MKKVRHYTDAERLRTYGPDPRNLPGNKTTTQAIDELMPMKYGRGRYPTP